MGFNMIQKGNKKHSKRCEKSEQDVYFCKCSCNGEKHGIYFKGKKEVQT